MPILWSDLVALGVLFVLLFGGGIFFIAAAQDVANWIYRKMFP